jgi:hypothetical protein
MLGLLLLSEPGTAGGKDLKDSVLKIAAAVKKGDTSDADKQAAALAKKVEDLADAMDLFKKRDKGGIGVGSKAGVAVPDGIESKVQNLSKEAPSATTLKKEGEALEEMGYAIAALGMVAKGKPAPKTKGKDWSGWCDDIIDGGKKLSAAAKSQNAADLKTIAGKINNACNACHSAYRN